MAMSPRFLKRLITGLILAPVALFLLVFHPYTFLLAMAPFLVMSIVEWNNIVQNLPKNKKRIAMMGFAYIPICFFAFFAIRFYQDDMVGCAMHNTHLTWGAAHILALMITVWASDTGAYVMGKSIGGPKLVPKISPNKTWAGFAGAMIWAMGAYTVTFMGVAAYANHMDPGCIITMDLKWLIINGAAIGLISQVGDLFISMLKRRANLKDTGNIIPGHGGVLDRIDGLMLATLYVYITLRFF